jgi:hypothetical protein
MLHVDNVSSKKLGHLIYYMTTFIVGVIVAWKLVLFTLGVVPLTADIDGLTTTPWASSLQEPGCDLQGQQHRQEGGVVDTDRAVVRRQGACAIWIVESFVCKKHVPRAFLAVVVAVVQVQDM